MAAFVGVGSTRGCSRRGSSTGVTCSASRREALKWLVLSAPAVLLSSPAGEAKALAVKDLTNGFHFDVPDGFAENNTVLSGGRKLYLYVKGEENISAVATPIPGDYQKLTSFGTVDNVAKTLLPSGVSGKINSVEQKSSYYIFDYSITPKDRAERRLLTLFTIRPGNCIITVTAQCAASDFPTEEKKFRGVLSSFGLDEQPTYD